MSKFLLPSALSAAVLLTSCATMRGTVDAVKSSTASATKSVKDFSLADLRGPRLDVVEVREKDLKEMPTGQERALAFDQERKRSFWSFALPADFEEPVLPEIGDGDLDSGLLPPKPL